VISPRTTEKAVSNFTSYFDLKKVPKQEAKLELSNFNDNLYTAKINGIKTHFIFTGYTGANVGFVIAQYQKNYLKHDPSPEAYFIGSILKAKRAKHLKFGDVIYAVDTYGDDEWAQGIYRQAKIDGKEDITKGDKNLAKRVLKIAKDIGVTLKPAKIYCRWHPGTLKKYRYILDLIDEGMWWKFTLSEGEYEGHDFDGGEIESASFTATCNLAGIPSIALYDVRDERVAKGYDGESYRTADKNTKQRAQGKTLELVKRSISSLK